MTAGLSPDDHGADAPRPQGPSGDPFSHLFAAILADLSRLVRGEIALMRAEVRASIRRAGGGIALLLVALVTGIAAVVVLAQAIAAGLHALGLPHPAAAAITGLALALAAGLCGYIGLRRLSPAALIPDRALRNLGRDGAALFRKENDDA